MQNVTNVERSRRKVSSLPALGILFAPGIFVWFLLREGHSVLSRVIGYVWALLMTMVWVPIIGVASSDQPANPERVEASQFQSSDALGEPVSQHADQGFDGRNFEIEAVVACETKIK